MHQDTTCYGGRPQHRRHCVRWGPSSPTPKGHSPPFSAHVRYGQTAGWIKMPLCTEVDLGPGDIVLDGDPVPPSPKKGTQPPILAHVRCGQTAGWTKMSLGTEVRLGLGDFVLDGDPAPTPKNGALPPPNFRRMSIVAKRLDGSRCHFVRR